MDAQALGAIVNMSPPACRWIPWLGRLRSEQACRRRYEPPTQSRTYTGHPLVVEGATSPADLQQGASPLRVA